MRRPRLLSRRPRVSGDKDTVPELSRRQARRAERAIAARDMPSGDVPRWVSDFRRWGVPAAAILVLVLCAPGEQHLGDLAGWGYRMSWGLSGLFTLYAGLAAVISTQLPHGARGKTSSVWGAFLSLALAMAAQPVSHLFVTGYISVEPRPPLWLVVTVSSVPPLILGHLLHFAAMSAAERPRSVPVPEDKGQDIHQSPVATVTRLRPRPVPSPVPSVPAMSPVGQSTGQPVSRPSVPAASNVLSLTKGQPTASPGQTAGQNSVSLSARAEELWLSGWDKDKIRDTLGTEFVSPGGEPPKRNSVTKAITRAEAKHPRP
jgi:hypothetical protein